MIIEEDYTELINKLREELKDLNAKIIKILNFQGTLEWHYLPSYQKHLLNIQLQAMKTYSEILNTRVDLIGYEIKGDDHNGVKK